jgi:large subunit ribosomal protein L17
MGFRVGDNAPMAYIELMDRPEVTDVEDAVVAE